MATKASQSSESFKAVSALNSKGSSKGIVSNELPGKSVSKKGSFWSLLIEN